MKNTLLVWSLMLLSFMPAFAADILPGYIPEYDRPDSLALIPPPPEAGSAAQALDESKSRKSVALRDSPRWALAIQDADITSPNAAGTFSCALQAPVNEKDSPHLYRMLRRVVTDAGLSTYKAKIHYQRVRPFTVNQQPLCTPSDKEALEKDGSYPSGHAAVGWAWALVLAEVLPEQANAILARGRAYGESRVICNVHWYSDIVEGRFIGAAVVARLHSEDAFKADLEAAKAELATAHAKKLPPTRDCQEEAAALATGSLYP